jgi:hypothetical protein
VFAAPVRNQPTHGRVWAELQPIELWLDLGISIVADGANTAKSVEGLASKRHDALTERVFRLVRRVSAWRFIAARALAYSFC